MSKKRLFGAKDVRTKSKGVVCLSFSKRRKLDEKKGDILGFSTLLLILSLIVKCVNVVQDILRCRKYRFLWLFYRASNRNIFSRGKAIASAHISKFIFMKKFCISFCFTATMNCFFSFNRRKWFESDDCVNLRSLLTRRRRLRAVDYISRCTLAHFRSAVCYVEKSC